jgi:hypothetical protein
LCYLLIFFRIVILCHMSIIAINKNYLNFDFDDQILGKKMVFGLVSFFPEVAQQIQFVRALTAHGLGQLIFFRNLYINNKQLIMH